MQIKKLSLGEKFGCKSRNCLLEKSFDANWEISLFKKIIDNKFGFKLRNCLNDVVFYQPILLRKLTSDPQSTWPCLCPSHLGPRPAWDLTFSPGLGAPSCSARGEGCGRGEKDCEAMGHPFVLPLSSFVVLYVLISLLVFVLLKLKIKYCWVAEGPIYKKKLSINNQFCEFR